MTMSTAPAFVFSAGWQSLADGDADALREFWLAEGAFTDASQIEQRLPQVICLARDGDQVAGVCTAVAVTPANFGQPMYYFRVFIGKRWRSTRLVGLMWLRARDILETFARANGFPCIGILVELENAGFREKGRRPVWPGLDLTYIGKSPRGLETRVYFFRGARMK
jgi:hypothetical protein